jgi:hypothetical protein
MSLLDNIDAFILMEDDCEDERRRKYFEEHPDEDFYVEDNDEWFGFIGGDFDE